MTGKYAPLGVHLQSLAARGDSGVELSFADVEALVGPLPASARQYRPWWGNSSHVQALEWRAAGWYVDTVSLDRERVRFALGRIGGSYAGRGRKAAAESPTPRTRRTQTPPSTVDAPHPDVVLVGCVKQKAAAPMPARDLYTSPLFTKRRRYAEATDEPWFILSGKLGLVRPQDVIEPYDLYLGDQPRAAQLAWGERVVQQLAEQFDISDGQVVEVHAGRIYIAAVAEPLRRLGAELSTPVRVGSQGEMLAWYDSHGPAPKVGRLDDRVAEALSVLSTAAHALTQAQLIPLSAEIRRPGLYSWWVDADGASDLSGGLRHDVRSGLIYAGQAGARNDRTGKVSDATLGSRLLKQHFRGSSGGSTFRLTLGSVLSAERGIRVEEKDISAWMDEHLRVIPWPTTTGGQLLRIERAVLLALDPPLNLDEVLDNPLRLELKRLRKIYRDGV